MFGINNSYSPFLCSNYDTVDLSLQSSSDYPYPQPLSPFHLTNPFDPQLPSSLHSLSSEQSESPESLTASFTSLESSQKSDKRKKWTAEQEKLLKEAVKIYVNDWEKISSLVPGTTSKQCNNKWIQIKKVCKTGRWSNDEDRELRKAVEKCGVGNWVEVANEIPQRNPGQCFKRWGFIKNKKVDDCVKKPRSSLSCDKENKKMKWTAEKIEQLREAVKIYGEKKWKKISSLISGSTPKKCYIKWREIKKKIKKGLWSSQENKQLREAVEKYGKNWIKVASQIPERSHTQCRHRWEKLNAKESDQLNVPFSPNDFFNQELTTPLPSSFPFPENLSKRKVILSENHEEIESSSKRQKTLGLLTASFKKR